MTNGTTPTATDHRDFDYIKSHHPKLYAGLAAAPTFPAEYLTDAGLWMPNQNAPEPLFRNPALPFGCTDYTAADLANDEVKKLLCNPMQLDDITHANLQGGYDVRQALLAAKKLGWIGNVFNIKAYAPLDYFDALRLAISSGYPELRSVSWGSPWFSEWETAAYAQSVMPTPRSLSTAGLSWHNSKFAGWTTMNGSPYLINKSWQGATIGNKGFLYFSRDVVNSVMSISGTVAFTATQTTPASIQTIDINIIRWLLSLIGLRY